jgi:single-stranded-DNA-specific exonuclease
MTHKQWTILASDPQKTLALQKSLGISRILCRILVQRGIDSFEKARSYFRPGLEDLHDPWLMKDMDRAVARVLQAIRNQEKILLYGDYDVDGTTSVACLFDFLRPSVRPDQLDFYIPNRYREGYGISIAGVEWAIAGGFSLVIALDCGIKSAALIGFAREHGVDFIVCDHHLPDPELPPAAAILNPKQPGCLFPYKELCGCGVGFQFMRALTQRLGRDPEQLTAYLDLVATAIGADIVPITGENRVLAYYGLRKANQRPNPGIRALIELSGARPELRMQNLVFLIAPRINAAGRMDDARKAVEMFLASTYEEALWYARLLHADNSDRKEADSAITGEALALIEQDESVLPKRSTVVFQSHWHKGVVGIVASRLIERYYRPTVVLTQNGEMATGSARGINGFNLYEAIHACRDYLVGYGGHYAAAGLTLRLDQVEAFRIKFEEVVSGSLGTLVPVPEIRVDAEVDFPELTESLLRIVQQMEPFGPENGPPVFLTRGVYDTGHSRIVKDKHLRFSVQQQGALFTGIGFSMADQFPLVSSGQAMDLVYTLEENEWNGQKNMQLHVLDLRVSGSDTG